MKKILLPILPLLALLTSCKNKDLCVVDHDYKTNIKVVIHWEDEEDKPEKGMMINLFPIGSWPLYGMDQMPADGGDIMLTLDASYFSLCYDYYAKTVHFRNEFDSQLIEAYTVSQVRSTYSRAFPEENTVGEPDFPFFVDRVNNFFVADQDLHFYPENVVEVFTFEIRNITGVEHISATRGGIGGMSASYFLGTGLPSDTPSTVLFDAAKNVDAKTITGSFRTFGRVASRSNMFTIEILYPSANGGIVHGTWDVTDQVVAALHIPGIPDIIIDNNNVVPPIIPDDDELGSGFDADVQEWENIYVPMPM